MSLHFITIKTLNRKGENDRNVTLSFSPKHQEWTLLGNIEHGTNLVINRDLLDSLYKIVKDNENGKV